MIEFHARTKDRRRSKSWLHKAFLTFVTIIVVALIALICRAYFCEAFVVPTDAAAPEVPRGSRVLAWKLSSTFVPGDLIVYRLDDKANLGRVTGTEGTELIVNRNGQANTKIARDAVVGKVICVYWRASPTPSSGSTTQGPPPTPVPERTPSQPTDDRTVRIDALHKALKIVDARYNTGSATVEDRISASDALLHAQLDAARTESERIAICRKLLDNRREYEKIIEAKLKSGKITELEWTRAKADLLEAESRLAKELDNDPLQSPRAADMRAIVLAGVAYAMEHTDWPKQLDELQPKYLDAKIDLRPYTYRRPSAEEVEKSPLATPVLSEKQPTFAGGHLAGFADGYVGFFQDVRD